MSDPQARLTIVDLSSRDALRPAVNAFHEAMQKHFAVVKADRPDFDCLNIVFGLEAQLKDGRWPQLPPSTIVFNDSPSIGDAFTSTRYLDYLINFPVIDPSLESVSRLQSMGLSQIAHVPLDCHPAFEIELPNRAKRFDVALIGRDDRRRHRAGRKLADAGLRIVELSEVQSKAAKESLAAAHVAVLIKQSEKAPPDEILIAQLASTGLQLVAEGKAGESRLGANASSVTFVPSQQIVKECVRQLAGDRPSVIALNLTGSTPFDKSIDQLKAFVLQAGQRPEGKSGLASLLAFRRDLLEQRTKSPAGLLAAVDYALRLHDRVHDVEDLFLNADFVASLQLLALVHLYEPGRLPESHCVLLERPLIEKVAGGEHKRLSEHGKLLAARAMARLGEMNLFLDVVASCDDVLEVVKASLAWATFGGLESFEAATQCLGQSGVAVPTCVRAHIAAELHWRAEQFSRAADIYGSPEAREISNFNSGHALDVASRLAKFGDVALSLAYDTTAPGPTKQGDGSPGLPIRLPQEICAALERNECYAGHRVSFDGNRVVVGEDSNRTTRLLLEGDLVITDTRFQAAIAARPVVSAVAIISCFNEVDVLESVLHSHLGQGIEVHVIDNWSSDGSWELLNLMVGAHPALRIERFPADGPSDTYDWRGLLTRKEEIAATHPGKWILHSDADEIRRTPWEDISLAEGLGIAEHYGCNAVDFAVLNFRPVDEGFRPGMNPEAYFPYFELGTSADLRYQVKCWKQGKERVSLAARGGHSVSFQGKVVFPIKFLCKHYPIRSRAHAMRKIVDERRNRFSADEKKAGWHSHYDGIDPSQCVWNWQNLERFTSVGLSALSYSLVHGV